MKILAFTAGAAQMYCGSCIRDNALAAELKSQGHDIVLQPIYTPTLTDEANVAAHKVFFGGIPACSATRRGSSTSCGIPNGL